MKNYKTYNALKIAKYFLKLGEKDETMTCQKLIKLVIVANGWHLSLSNGIPLITESIEAWKYGDIVPSVYDKYRKFGTSKITDAIEKQDIEKITKNFLKEIWRKYGEYNGMQLSSNLSKKGTPYKKQWAIACNTTKSIDLCIPNKFYHNYYNSLRK